MPRTAPILLALLATTLLAGCGAPDEQESDENEASEQESVGEGEVPGLEAAGFVLAVVAGALLYARMR